MSGREEARGASELRRRISLLMLFRLVLITIVLSLNVLLNLASPQDLALPGSISVFAIVGATYSLSLLYALLLPRIRDPRWFANVQFAGDLLITTALVHVSGGAQSAYTFFYPLSIIAAAIVHYRRGAVIVAAISVLAFAGVAWLGWKGVLPVPSGQRVDPREMSDWQFIRQVLLNVGAMTAVAFLAATLGEQLARAGQILQRQEAATLDLAALNDDIIRCLSSGLVTVDRQGRVLTINEAAGEILGLEPGKSIGRPIRELVPELDPILENLGDRSAVRRGEILARTRKRGELALGVSISPLSNHRAEPLGRIVNFQDLTELRRMEEQVKRGERLVAIGGVAAGIAHEIRNPLASISGSIELLRSAPQVDAENRALMEIVLREVDRLNALVTELIDYAKPRAPVPVAIDAASAIKETVRVFAQDRSGPPVTVRFAEPAGRPPIVHADAAQLRQVIWNLLLNAAESMPDGGEVVVTLGSDETWCTIEVRDHGVGIPREDHERIFEPFFTTKARGSGLGLATVHRIVVEHGGVISVESEPGKGTSVRVRLPVADGVSSGAP